MLGVNGGVNDFLNRIGDINNAGFRRCPLFKSSRPDVNGATVGGSKPLAASP